mmetsp:Transcript_88247/g.285657  ORF Transcript_88247/g.285657 Transcript_88247/m.285657 type:complete len:309 (-) Transcript_88247:85-1011(-)
MLATSQSPAQWVDLFRHELRAAHAQSAWLQHSSKVRPQLLPKTQSPGHRCGFASALVSGTGVVLRLRRRGVTEAPRAGLARSAAASARLYPFPTEALHEVPELVLDDCSFLQVEASDLRARVVHYVTEHFEDGAARARSFRLRMRPTSGPVGQGTGDVGPRGAAAGEQRLSLAPGLGWHMTRWKGEALWVLLLAGAGPGAAEELVLFAQRRGRGRHLADFCEELLRMEGGSMAPGEGPGAAERAAEPPPPPELPTPKFWVQELVEEALREVEAEEQASQEKWSDMDMEEAEERGAKRLGLDFDPLAPP